MRFMLVWVCSLVAMTGCEDDILLHGGDDLHTPDDLGADDLGDLSTAADLSYDFCADVMAALGGAPPNNCAVGYMRDLTRCMAPAGHCSPSTTNTHVYCWESGVALTLVGAGTSRVTQVVGTPSAQQCRTEVFPGVSSSFCLESATHSCTGDSDAGTAAGVNAGLKDNTFTCPDGSTVVVGPLTTACKTTLDHLVNPTYTCDGLGSVTTCPYPL
jgi:hypothetical protein